MLYSASSFSNPSLNGLFSILDLSDSVSFFASFHAPVAVSISFVTAATGLVVSY
jgi:hypothetical protein